MRQCVFAEDQLIDQLRQACVAHVEDRQRASPLDEKLVFLDGAPVDQRQNGDGAQVDRGRLGGGRLATALGAGTEQDSASGHHTPQSECRYAARDRVPPRKESMPWAFL